MAEWLTSEKISEQLKLKLERELKHSCQLESHYQQSVVFRPLLGAQFSDNDNEGQSAVPITHQVELELIGAHTLCLSLPPPHRPDPNVAVVHGDRAESLVTSRNCPCHTGRKLFRRPCQ